MEISALIVLSCAFWSAYGYPYSYPYYYGTNMDTLSLGASDSSRGGMVLSRYYNPYSNPGYGGGMAAFMFKPQEQAQAPSQYYAPDTRRQTQKQQTYVPPQQENEVYPYPQVSEKAPTTEVAELPDFTTDKADVTTPKTVLPLAPVTAYPELTESEIEEVEPERRPRKRVSKKKPVQNPSEEDEEDDETPKIPAGAFFPMFFGYGRNQGMGAGGATAVANAYSTGRGGVATSHATAFGAPRPDYREYKTPSELKKYQEANARL